MTTRKRLTNEDLMQMVITRLVNHRSPLIEARYDNKYVKNHSDTSGRPCCVRKTEQVKGEDNNGSSI